MKITYIDTDGEIRTSDETLFRSLNMNQQAGVYKFGDPGAPHYCGPIVVKYPRGRPTYSGILNNGQQVTVLEVEE